MNNTKQKSELVQLFERAAELLNLPITATFNQETREYDHKYLHLDFASCYGGYRLEIVNTNTGQSEFDSLTRKTKREMIHYLRGLIKGLTYNK